MHVNMHCSHLLLIIARCMFYVTADSPIISTAQGQIKGVSDTSRNGKIYHKFLGIPFGKVPSRFHNSVPAENWKGVWDGTKFGSACIQSDAFRLGENLGTEECLFLNIFTPTLYDGDTTKLLPVMVFIYGGGFNMGNTADYVGNYLTDQDVVLVTINYRVGAFGFLNAGIKGASGNQGLKDQILALKWIRDNIEEFGGNNNRTTIFGQSAGGASVNLLTLSPMAKGLFQGAIAMSGSATCPWANKNEPSLKNTQKLAAALDCPTSNTEYMVECLRRVDAKLIIQATKYPSLFGWNWEDVPQFGPTIEKHQDDCDDDADYFLTEDPFKIAVEGRFNKVPYMSGLVKHEGYLIWATHIINNENATKKINEEWSRLAPSSFYYEQSALDTCKVSSEIKKFYLQGKPVGKETSGEFINLHSDRQFNQCVKEMAVALGKHTDVYLYRFDKNVTSTIADLFKARFYPNDVEQPPIHVDELQFLFNIHGFYPEIKSGDKNANFSDSLSKMWTSFAKNGKPNDLWGSAKEWTPIEPSSNTPNWYSINDDTSFEMENKDFTQRMDFWASLPLNEYGRSARKNLDS